MMSRPTPTSLPNNPKLDRLLKEAAKRPMTSAERREQRISFVYGQMMDCAPHLTKDDVRRIDAEVYGEDDLLERLVMGDIYERGEAASEAADRIKMLEDLRSADAWLERALLELLYENGIEPSSADILKARRKRRERLEALDKLASEDQELGLE